MNEDRNSMTYWWPKVKYLRIPMPRTEIVELEMSHSEVFGILDGEKKSAEAWDKHVPKIQDAIQELGLPVFMRTDYTSGKHDWKNTCFLEDAQDIQQHISGLVEYSALADMIGLGINAIVIREYIPMTTGFTAFFGEMPVNPERRYFIRDGQSECHHAYWIPEAIEEGTRAEDLPHNWRELLAEMNTETPEEIELLSMYAERIAAVVDGYWSVDFCKAADGRWIFIDMAKGDASWHPPCAKGDDK